VPMQAKQAAARRTVLEVKTWVWEEFGEAMEEDCWSALKKFWQTVLAPQKGEAVLCQHCLQCSEEAGAGDSEVDSSITQAEVTESTLSDSGRTLRFHPGRGTLNQFYTLHRVLEGLWEFAPCPSWYSVGCSSSIWGPGPFAKGCSVSVQPEQELGSCIASSKSDLFQCMLDYG
ncbi:hypothetical protein L3Q82_012806, partial [Scortum barcoo]